MDDVERLEKRVAFLKIRPSSMLTFFLLKFCLKTSQLIRGEADIKPPRGDLG
jgi:hypothetical protein